MTRPIFGLYVLLLVLVLPPMARADGQADRCLHPDGWYFACGEIALYVEPAANVNAIVEACEPTPQDIDFLGSDAANGTLIYRLAVPVGSELQLVDCYNAQAGTDSAELIGFGQLSPDTAMIGGRTSVPVGLVVLLLSASALGVGVLATRSGASGPATKPMTTRTRQPWREADQDSGDA